MKDRDPLLPHLKARLAAPQPLPHPSSQPYTLRHSLTCQEQQQGLGEWRHHLWHPEPALGADPWPASRLPYPCTPTVQPEPIWGINSGTRNYLRNNNQSSGMLPLRHWGINSGSIASGFDLSHGVRPCETHTHTHKGSFETENMMR